MKLVNYAWMSLILIVATLTTSAAFATISENKVIKVTATATTSPPSITLAWPDTRGSRSFVLFRKTKEANQWGQYYAILPVESTSYTDTNVVPGTPYEYGLMQEVPGDAFPHGRFGYVYSGIDIPMVEDRGKIVLLVDSTHSTALAVQIARLQEDLAGDGWTVLRHDVSPTTPVPAVKNIILSEYNAAPTSVKAVYLLGHIPVPYSGNIYWDAHTNHKGAWPADIFYADMDGVWTDSTVSITTASRPQNHNVPGDGKYDQSIVPSRVELMVGRVDFYDMPGFGLSETQLLARYLDKSHDFRHAVTNARKRALVDDNLQSLSEGPAVSGWHLTSLVGASNVTAGDWTSLTTDDYLLGYGCGASGYTNVGGVASTANFAANSYRVMFQLFFGSYFGDWDNRNNVLRAAIAGPTYGMTSAWGSRPNWFLHHMGMGEPVGTGYMASTEVVPYRTSLGPGSVHVALMGDPTLRLSYTPPVSNLNTVTTGSGTNLTWTASTDSAVRGYHVYRSTGSGGAYTRLNANLVTSTSYTDTNPPAGTSTYMLRAVRLETSASGTYFNGSQGIFKSHTRSTATPPPAPVITTNGGQGAGANYVTNSPALVLAGTCDTSLVSVKVNNAANGVAYVPGNTNWSAAKTLQQGANVFAVTGVNAISQTSPADTITVTLDNVAPGAPSITTDGGNGVGLSFITGNSALILTGTATNDTAAIHVNGSAVGVTYIPATRLWTYAHTLSHGLNSFSVTALDSVGNSSAATSINVTLSTTPTTADSDGDGIPDTTELGAGTNPLDPQSFDPTLYVDGASGNDTTGLGTRAHPWATPAHAIASVRGRAATLLTIRVAKGQYSTLSATGGALVLDSYEHLLGGYEATGWTRNLQHNETVLDATIAGATGNAVILDGIVGAALDGFTVTGADSSVSIGSGGAGILCMDLDASSTIANCLVTGNFSNANGSGGMLLIDASPSITLCTVVANGTEGAGGGIGIAGNSAPHITRTLISGNDAALGAGIYAGDTANPVLTNSVLSGNLATQEGGALYLEGAGAIVSNCTIAHNTAGTRGGGGARIVSGESLFADCIFFGNVQMAVSAVSNTPATRLENCLFNANTKGDYYSPNAGSPLTLTGAAAINSQVPGATANIDGSPSFNLSTTRRWTAAPVYNPATRTTRLTDSAAAWVPGALRGSFVALSPDSVSQALVLNNTATTIDVLANYTAVAQNGGPYRIVDYRIGAESAAIDAGRTTRAAAYGSVTVDLDGANRGLDGDGNGAATGDGSDCDIGAFEREGVAATAKLTVLSPNGGEVLVGTREATVRWSSSGAVGGEVRIVAWRGTSSRVITNSTNNNGSFAWIIPANFAPGSAYRIEISSVSAPSISDTSDGTFTIVAP